MNDFLDVVFKRYSNPLILFDGLIETNQFADFVDTIKTKYTEDLEYELWLHKVYNKSFDEFKESMRISKEAQNGYMNEDDIKTTIQKSADILGDFNPQ